MTLFEDNNSPYLTIVEQGSTPSNPASGKQKLFIRNSDHVLCRVDSSGTITVVGEAAIVQDWKASVRVATTANITLSGTQTIDGVSVIANDRVLVKDQSTGANNGIYVCAAGAWSRATDFDASSEVTAGTAVPVEEGTTNGDKIFLLTTNNPITLGSTALAFTSLNGSGGVANAVGTYSSLPAAGNTGKIYLPTDGLSIQIDDGAAWQAFGPVWPLTVPIKTGWSWVNQGTATVDESKDYISLTAPANGTSNLRVRVRTAPATPYTITALITANTRPINFTGCGLLFRESSSGKMHTMALGYSSGRIFLSQAYNGPTAGFNTTYASEAEWELRKWLRIADNGTNRVMSISHDGITWYAFHTISRTSFLTADQIGFYVDSNNATYDATMVLHSWKQT